MENYSFLPKIYECVFSMYVGKTRHTPDTDTVICNSPVKSGIAGDHLELDPDSKPRAGR